MHPEIIRADIRIKYGTLTEFELKHNLPPRSVSDVLYGKSRPKVARAIAKALGKDLDIIFPGQRERETRREPSKFQKTIKSLRACQPPSRKKVA